jgi:hypothetical protein
VAGIVTGVVAGLALMGAVVLGIFRGCLGLCFGRKKKAATGAEPKPPAYGVTNKDAEPQVQEVAPGAK